MTKFNSENKEILTIGEALSPAMGITEQEDADQYFKEYIEYIRFWSEKDPNIQGRSPEEIAQVNLGYFAGYYDYETMGRISLLFKINSPYLQTLTAPPKL